MNTKAHKTAIARTAPSVPMKFLDKEGLLVGRILDFGCGRGFDANHFNTEKYDPHYSPEMPSGKFDTIVCNYVLNVVEESVGDDIIKSIKQKLTNGGYAYITVRRDVKQDGYTSTGTYQRNVILDAPIVKKSSSYCIYKIG